MSGGWRAGTSDKSNRGAAIVAEGVSHRYPGADGSCLTVLDDLALEVEEGDRVAISGRSGAGKTTLLALLGGLERLQHGSLWVGGVDVASLAGDDLAAYRRETVGFVFQHFGLLDSLTALENVELALSVRAVAARTRRARARDVLARGGARRAGRPSSARAQRR